MNDRMDELRDEYKEVHDEYVKVMDDEPGNRLRREELAGRMDSIMDEMDEIDPENDFTC